MKMKVEHIKPGMILGEDIKGISGKLIVPKHTVLQEKEITFIKKFLVKEVLISGKVASRKDLNLQNKGGVQPKQRTLEGAEPTPVIQSSESHPLMKQCEYAVLQYEKFFSQWKNNLPVNMYEIRTQFIPLFEEIGKYPLLVIKKQLISEKALKDSTLFYRNVAAAILSIALAQQLQFKKRDWLQIGFATLLSDVGLAKSNVTIESDRTDRRHPIISYEMIKDEATLTNVAKLSILQHHERNDGSGFPMKLKGDKIHMYAKIIAVSMEFMTKAIQSGNQAGKILLQDYRTKLDVKVLRQLLGK